MNLEPILAAEFAGLSNQLVRQNRSSLPGETMYFLSHQRQFASDLAVVSGIHKSAFILELGRHPFVLTTRVSIS